MGSASSVDLTIELARPVDASDVTTVDEARAEVARLRVSLARFNAQHEAGTKEKEEGCGVETGTGIPWQEAPFVLASGSDAGPLATTVSSSVATATSPVSSVLARIDGASASPPSSPSTFASSSASPAAAAAEIKTNDETTNETKARVALSQEEEEVPAATPTATSRPVKTLPPSLENQLASERAKEARWAAAATESREKAMAIFVEVLPALEQAHQRLMEIMMADTVHFKNYRTESPPPEVELASHATCVLFNMRPAVAQSMNRGEPLMPVMESWYVGAF